MDYWAKKVTFNPLDGARLREELADKEAELTAALAKSRDLSQELAATGGQLRQELAAKTEALAASAKELDSLKRSLGKIPYVSADPFFRKKKNRPRFIFPNELNPFKSEILKETLSRAVYFFVCLLMSSKVSFQKLYTTLYNYSVLRIRIRDPGLGTFLTPGSGIRDPGWEKVRIRIRDPG